MYVYSRLRIELNAVVIHSIHTITDLNYPNVNRDIVRIFGVLQCVSD
jgi:hypothetical protein